MDLALAIEEARPGARYRLNKSVPPDQAIIEWRGPGDEPTQKELESALQIYSEQEAAEQAASDQLKANIVTTARSAVGVILNDLSQAQTRALLAVILWKAGGVAPDMTVKPLKDWGE